MCGLELVWRDSFGSGSGSCRGTLPNILLEELFFSKKQRSRNVLEEPLERSRAKHPLNNELPEQLVRAWIRRTPHEPGGMHFDFSLRRLSMHARYEMREDEVVAEKLTGHTLDDQELYF